MITPILQTGRQTQEVKCQLLSGAARIPSRAPGATLLPILPCCLLRRVRGSVGGLCCHREVPQVGGYWRGGWKLLTAAGGRLRNTERECVEPEEQRQGTGGSLETPMLPV